MSLGTSPSEMERSLDERERLELFNRSFGLDLEKLPGDEERFFLGAFIRGHMTFLLNQTNMPACEAHELFEKEPSKNRDEALGSLRRVADLRKKAGENETAFNRAKDLLRALGFDVDAWGLAVDPFPTIESISKGTGSTCFPNS